MRLAVRAVSTDTERNTLAKICQNPRYHAWQNTNQKLSGKKMRLWYGAGYLGGEQQETAMRILGSKRWGGSERGRRLCYKNRDKAMAEHSTTDREWSVTLWLSGEGPAEEPRPALQLNLAWEPGSTLGTSLHFSGLGALICEMVTVILISRSNYEKNCTWGCLAPCLACRRWSIHF